MGAISPGCDGLGLSASPIWETTDRDNLPAISPLKPLILPRSMAVAVGQSDRTLRLSTRQNLHSGYMPSMATLHFEEPVLISAAWEVEVSVHNFTDAKSALT